jgi:formate dehydrogenase alpha subunit
VLVFGADVTAEAPALDWQIELACRKRDGLLVVANMRKVKLSRYANTNLGYRPGSEVALALALSRILLDRGLFDRDYLSQFVGNLEEIEPHLRALDLDAAVAQTGLSMALLEEAALSIGQADSVAILFGGDVLKGEQAEEKVAALANLALLCGALHGDVGGLFPIDEKGNMQGLLDMGVYPESLPGYQPYASAAAKFEAAWGVKLPKGGRNALEILAGIEQGSIKALYLAATNPLTFPESGRWRKALAKLALLVVQDILPSEVTEMAHVVLPGSSFAEKSGSVTALDGRVSCLAQAIKPVGEAREDWEILAELYNRLVPGHGQIQPQQLLGEAKSLTDLYGDICLAGSGRCQPCLRAPFRPGPKSLKYSTVTLSSPVAAGLQLLSGKLLFHFGTTTTFAAGPLQVAPCGYVEIHPEDAARAGLVDGGQVKVSSAIGSIQGPVRLSENVPQGLLFAPHHFAELNVQSLLPTGQNRVAVQISKA